MLDLSVPRNVEPSARAVAGVRLFDLDDLQQLRCPASGFDAPAIGEAEQLLRREIERLLRALDAREVAPRLAQLHRAAERLVEEESERALRELGDLSEQERRVVRAGSGVTFLPDDLHSIHIEQPLLNFHLYGLALEQLARREYYVPEEHKWAIFPPHSDIREARGDRA